MDLDPIDIPIEDELEWDQLFIEKAADDEDSTWIDPVTGKVCWHRKHYSDTPEYDYFYYYENYNHIHPEYEKILRDYLCIPTLEEIEWLTEK